MKEKLIRFMYGRYGTDSFNRFLLVMWFVLVLLTRFRGLAFLSIFTWPLLIYCYYRMFSRNIYKRAAENQAFLKHTAKLRTIWHREKNLLAQRKTHHIYRCPSCKQKIRIPKGKGKIEIRCPKCNTTFIKRS